MIQVKECFSFFSYWKSFRKLDIKDVYPEYNHPYENEVLVMVGNSCQMIGLGIAEDIDDEYEMSGIVTWFNLGIIPGIELKYVYQCYFCDYNFTDDVKLYHKQTTK